MASSTPPPLSSFSTALVLLPPPQIQSRINPLRSANDKSFPRWTSHLTLVFPFVEPPALPTACTLLRDALSKAKLHPFHFQLDKVGKFQQWESDTVYLGPSQPTEIQRLWEAVSSPFRYSGRPLVPHLTLGQARRRDDASAFLQSKGALLLEQVIKWDVCSIVVLSKSASGGGLMEIYEEISLSSECSPPQEAIVTGMRPDTYHFGPERWTPCRLTPLRSKTITLATYNIFYDSRFPIKIRFQALLSTLLDVQPIPDVVCLQEVTDEFLRLLVADSGIRSRWPLCTHDPTSVLPNERNVVCLAQEAFRFTWEYAQLNKHKPAVILQASLHGAEPLIIAGIHLTAGLKAPKSLSKLQELDGLTQYLHQQHSSSPWVIIGDFNVPTSQAIPPSIMENFHDTWLTVRGSEHGGATYDPESNALAAESVKDDCSPQRYDRIWVRRNAGVKADSIEKFGLGRNASDHYGLIASFSLSVDAELEPMLEASNMALEVSSMHQVSHIVAGSGMIESDERLEEAVWHAGGFPTTSQRDERVCVATTLRSVLSVNTQGRSLVEVSSDSAPSTIQSQSAVRFEFVPVGSFGLGVDTQDSDVDILVVGNIPPRTFWSLTRALLNKAASNLLNIGVMEKDQPYPITVKRFVKDTSVPMMELVVGNVRVDMQYCSASKVLEWYGLEMFDALCHAMLIRTAQLGSDTYAPTHRPSFPVTCTLPAHSECLQEFACRTACIAHNLPPCIPSGPSCAEAFPCITRNIFFSAWIPRWYPPYSAPDSCRAPFSA
jgi:endonuclease/exonuclease/phosphatase family metal-dependent hydrolase/2'-5' RNA ligase